VSGLVFSGYNAAC